jgi:hypothetical protein
VSTNLVLGIVSSLLASALIAVLVMMRKRWGPAFSDLPATLRLARRLRTLGVLQVFGSRSDYQTYRGTATLMDYFRLAHTSVEMAAYWISYGVETQGLAEEVCGLLLERPALSVTLAVVDPCSTHLDALAKHLNRPSEEVRDRIIKSLVKLTTARAQLTEPVRYRYHIKIYSSLPVASVIMLDRTEDNGRIQVDIKPYHAAQHNSFAIELANADSPLYQHLSDAWGQLMLDAKELEGGFSENATVNELGAGG